MQSIWMSLKMKYTMNMIRVCTKGGILNGQNIGVRKTVAYADIIRIYPQYMYIKKRTFAHMCLHYPHMPKVHGNSKYDTCVFISASFCLLHKTSSEGVR